MKKSKDQIRTEALEVVRQYVRSGVNMSMGSGKTRLGLDHFQLVMNKMHTTEDRPAKGLVVAPTKKILKGWKAEAEKWGIEHLLDGLQFTTYLSLTKQDKDFDVIYLDECHNLKLNHDEWLSHHKGYFLGLTGTPPKYKRSEKGRMIDKYCPIRYTYTTDEAIGDGLLNDYRITVHLLELDSDNNHKVEIKNKTGEVVKSWWTSERKDYEYWTDQVNYNPGHKWMSIRRMNAMKGYATKLDYAHRLLEQTKRKCIVFANTQKQADLLCSHSYHSENPDSETNMSLFESGEIDKLSAVFQLSEGANIKGLDEVIILHAYGNNRKASQRLGRGLRLDPNETAYIHILCYKDTVDEKWVQEALEGYDQSKIEWYDPDDF